MNATTMQPMRWRIRSACEQVGIGACLGGAQPGGRRIGVLCRPDGSVSTEDRSARWRGHLLWIERPAVLSAPESEVVARTAADLARLIAPGAQLDLEFDLAGDDLTLTGARLCELDAQPPGCEILVAAGDPAAERPRVAGTIMALELPSSSSATITAGDTVDLAAWTTVVRIQAADRAAAAKALSCLILAGIPTTAGIIRQALAEAGPGLRARDLDRLVAERPVIEVLAGGLHTTVQDWPGRIGYWPVGVPPSGPMDDLAFRLANRLVGNPPGTPGLEITLSGPTLRMHAPAIIALAGCAVRAEVDGAPLEMWRAVAVPAGAVVRIHGPVAGGVRCALAVRGGLDVQPYLGSAATFDLGGFGGAAGRPLAAGDRLHPVRAVPGSELASCPPPLPAALRPVHARTWEIGVLEGPHAAPDFLTPAGMRELYAATWTVHQHSNRTGIRLVGPKPRWSRTDGGEAGLHPSNIHDNAYAFGAVDLTGDMPIILGPDGPSCGGFVCPAVVVQAERWKLGQLRPGDAVRLVRLTETEARARTDDLAHLVERLATRAKRRPPPGDPDPAVLVRQAARGGRPALCVRRCGDDFVLLEYGEAQLDLALRLRVELLDRQLAERRIPGILEVTPGVRSLQVHHDPGRLAQRRVVDLLLALDSGLPDAESSRVASRTVHLPLSWDDPETRKAIDIYMRSVRADAPWCPWNIEFIRRINGLPGVDAVKRIVYDAEYLVVGLGDVYLGAPVATPVDPRHRLVTTKYNPARTWTPENAVGIGGAYMCIYGMEGPGGYQFVGRTVPVWNSFRSTASFARGRPWLLRNFDRIRWYEVGAEELLDLRADLRAGRWDPRIEDGVFDGAAYGRFLAEQAAPIEAFRRTQRAAFAAERERWSREGR